MSTASEIVAAYQSGVSVEDLAKQTGREARRINQTLREAGIHVPKKSTVVTLEAITAAQEEGTSPADLARRLGVTNGAVHIQLRALGVRLTDGRTQGKPRGRKQVRVHGYLMDYRPDHPYCDKSGRVMVHRLVMEEHLGRVLDPKEVVHHMNHVRDDNRLENLLLLPDQRAHMQIHSPSGRPAAPGGNDARWKKSA